MGEEGHWGSGDPGVKELTPVETYWRLGALHHNLARLSLDSERPLAHVDRQQGQTPYPPRCVTLITMGVS